MEENIEQKPQQSTKKTKKRALTGRKKVFFDALVSQVGNVSQAERTVLNTTGLKIPRDTHYYWKEKDPNYKAWCDDLPELEVDFYEAALKKAAQNGNVAAAIFGLKCKGKERGWVEKTEQNINVTTNKGDFIKRLTQVNQEVNGGDSDDPDS